MLLGLLSLVLICRRTTCDIAIGTAWDTVQTYENIRRRQQQPSQAFTADVPAKLNSSQLHRLADVKACDGRCCLQRMFSYRNSIPGSTGIAQGSSTAYENQALDCYVYQTLFSCILQPSSKHYTKNLYPIPGSLSITGLFPNK